MSTDLEPYQRAIADSIAAEAARTGVPAHLLHPSRATGDARRVARAQTTARTLPAVPDWVQDPAKWVTLSRADRRALERHHRKQQRR